MNQKALLIAGLVLLLVILPMTLDEKPKGIRNNNPGNIRNSTTTAWKGEIAPDPSGFERFSSSYFGLRAAARLVSNYPTKYGVHTIYALSLKWAPITENDPLDHAMAISQSAGLNPYSYIDLRDPAIVAKVVKGIVAAENGFNHGKPWYTDSEIQGATAAAFA